MASRLRPSLQRMEDWRRRMVECVRECRRIGYPPDAWLKQMAMHDDGAWGASIELVDDPKLQEGLWRLASEFHRTDLTVEWNMIQPEWNDIFTDEDCRRAREKLKQVGWNDAE